MSDFTTAQLAALNNFATLPTIMPGCAGPDDAVEPKKLPPRFARGTINARQSLIHSPLGAANPGGVTAVTRTRPALFERVVCYARRDPVLRLGWRWRVVEIL